MPEGVERGGDTEPRIQHRAPGSIVEIHDDCTMPSSDGVCGYNKRVMGNHACIHAIDPPNDCVSHVIGASLQYATRTPHSHPRMVPAKQYLKKTGDSKNNKFCVNTPAQWDVVQCWGLLR